MDMPTLRLTHTHTHRSSYGPYSFSERWAGGGEEEEHGSVTASLHSFLPSIVFCFQVRLRRHRRFGSVKTTWTGTSHQVFYGGGKKVFVEIEGVFVEK